MPPPPVAVYRSDDFLARVAFYQRFHVAAALTEALENRTPSEQRTVKLILFLYDGYLSNTSLLIFSSYFNCSFVVDW